MENLDPTVIAGASVAAKAFEAQLQALSNAIKSTASKQLKTLLAKLLTTFDDHLQSTHTRCTKIKTILSKYEPVELLTQYVNLDFAVGDKKFDDYSVIEAIKRHKRAIISGSGGGGKTIFLKYLWLTFFDNPAGRVPIFVELRRLNDIKVGDDDLLLYIFKDVIRKPDEFSEKLFREAIDRGGFTFIFDGFDEVVHDKRREIEKQILSLADRSSDSVIIVSGRSDDRFDSWQTFTNYRVMPLSKEKVISLVEKLNYDITPKRKFIERLRKGLYETHKSFLSNPLLATIMLMTFNEYADIPEKIHLFYQQAFDTLYNRHDASKEMFKRQTHANLAPDVFRRYFSYFCLLTYYSEKFDFSDDEILQFLDRTFRLDGEHVDRTKFLSDLTESTCLMQKDGLRYIFSHRSFQEYFAAYCLAYISQRHIEKLISKFAKRYQDSAIAMLYDMNRKAVDERYLIPNLQRIVATLSGKTGLDLVKSYVEASGVSMAVVEINEAHEVVTARRGARGKTKKHWRFLAVWDADTKDYGDAHYLKVVISHHLRKSFPTSVDRYNKAMMAGLDLEDEDRLIRQEIIPALRAAKLYDETDGVVRLPSDVANSPLAGASRILLESSFYSIASAASDLLQAVLAELTKMHERRDQTFDELFDLR